MQICTHDGNFHCDEVLACMMLTRYSNKFKGAKIVRSRESQVWNASDIIVDVGGQYDPPYKLDHHQVQFTGTYPNHDIKLSSAGLVYLHFPEIIPNIVQCILQKEKHKLGFEPLINEDRIYNKFIIYIDAGDNGINKVYDVEFVSVPSTLWSRVGKLNPMWWQNQSNQLELFHKAMQIAEDELYSEVRLILLGSIQTVSIVKQAYLNRQKVHACSKIILLEYYVPWYKSLIQCEKQCGKQGQVLYVVFPEKGKQKWRIQAVPLKEASFQLRKGLKEEWRGVKDMDKLVDLSGIADIDFVHVNGFIGGACSRQSAIKMGLMSL